MIQHYKALAHPTDGGHPIWDSSRLNNSENIKQELCTKVRAAVASCHEEMVQGIRWYAKELFKITNNPSSSPYELSELIMLLTPVVDMGAEVDDPAGTKLVLDDCRKAHAAFLSLSPKCGAECIHIHPCEIADAVAAATQALAIHLCFIDESGNQQKRFTPFENDGHSDMPPELWEEGEVASNRKGHLIGLVESVGPLMEYDVSKSHFLERQDYDDLYLSDERSLTHHCCAIHPTLSVPVPVGYCARGCTGHHDGFEARLHFLQYLFETTFCPKWEARPRPCCYCGNGSLRTLTNFFDVAFCGKHATQAVQYVYSFYFRHENPLPYDFILPPSAERLRKNTFLNA
ncbi:MAG: hypothetical protein JWM68_1287 [Verrucomicrobiales bacterium]|nr:hypothetical protein [Verrucomicrobiales bacterium]